jgi:hypothetical protein
MKLKLYLVPFTVFVITALSAAIANALQLYLFKYIILGASVVYIAGGWYFFRGYFPNAKTSTLFFYGYAYSSITGALAFSAFTWPMYNIFLWAGLFWIAAVQAVLWSQRNILPARGLVTMTAENIAFIILIMYHLFFAFHTSFD